ncbi:MAG: hypothetical protein RLZZ453_94 [Chlamydiota bacterium]|jgi:NTP pyrophosphatase (non-canonical NTP hydrolase)
MIHDPYSTYGSWADPTNETRKTVNQLSQKIVQLSTAVQNATVALENCRNLCSSQEDSLLDRVESLENQLNALLQTQTARMAQTVALSKRIDDLTCYISKPYYNQIQEEAKDLAAQLAPLAEECQRQLAKKRQIEQDKQTSRAEQKPTVPHPPSSKKVVKKAPKPPQSDPDDALLDQFSVASTPNGLPKPTDNPKLIEKIIDVVWDVVNLININNKGSFKGPTRTYESFFLRIGKKHFSNELAIAEIYKRIKTIDGIPLKECIFSCQEALYRFINAFVALRNGLEHFKCRIVLVNGQAFEFELIQDAPTPVIPRLALLSAPRSNWEDKLIRLLVELSNAMKLPEDLQNDVQIAFLTHAAEDLKNKQESMDAFKNRLQAKTNTILKDLPPFELEQLILDVVWDTLASDSAHYFYLCVKENTMFLNIPNGAMKPSLYKGKDGHCQISK